MGPQRYTPCAEFEGCTPDKLVDMCSGCGYFFPACCQCRKHGMSSPCHNAAVVYVDGACANNGFADARAGIGGALGGRVQDSWSMEITDDVDRYGKRTNQRAELLAAIHGLINLKTAHRGTEVDVLLVATDSEYVVKGMTEWYATWKSKGWLTSQGIAPSNLDLFDILMDAANEAEASNMLVFFWYIPRSYNTMADQLAKRAVQLLDIEPSANADHRPRPHRCIKRRLQRHKHDMLH